MWTWLVDTLRNYPSLAVFLTIGLGFIIGRLKYKSFSLGTVTSVLLVGVAVGQLDIAVPGPLKDVFFLLFLFAIGYSVGPQFFASLRGDGIRQVIFAVVVCVLCLLVTWGLALMMGYNVGEAVGIMAGAQTVSAVIGVGTDTINTLGASAADKQAWTAVIPVCYAVTYVFGTIGSAYILANLGPALLGGIKKVREETRALEAKLNSGSVTDDPNYVRAQRPVVFRAYKVSDEWFSTPRSVIEIEEYLESKGRRLFVERLRIDGKICDPDDKIRVKVGDEVVISGRREYVIGDDALIGEEVMDAALLDFPVEVLEVTVTRKEWDNITIDQLRRQPWMRGIAIRSVVRGGVEQPFLAQCKIHRGDIVTIVGLEREINEAAPNLGVAERKSQQSDLAFTGIGIFLGALIGAITIHCGGVPISLSTSGGALIMGLFLGWLRSRRPSFGYIPRPAVWLMDNLGLNMFIAVIGITSGPSFVSGLKEIGWMMFVIGALATAIPLIIAMILGKKVFKFPAAVNLGCVAGSRVTTASLGAIQDALGSTIPAMGYT